MPHTHGVVLCENNASHLPHVRSTWTIALPSFSVFLKYFSSTVGFLCPWLDGQRVWLKYIMCLCENNKEWVKIIKYSNVIKLFCLLQNCMPKTYTLLLIRKIHCKYYDMVMKPEINFSFVHMFDWHACLCAIHTNCHRLTSVIRQALPTLAFETVSAWAPAVLIGYPG